MVGLKVSTGEPIIHIGLLVGICFLPRDQKCETRDFSTLMTLFLAVHAINGARLILSMVLTPVRALYPDQLFVADFTERLYSLFCMCVTIWTIIIGFDQYLFTDITATCTRAQIGLSLDWLLIELAAFCLTFITNILFILTSSCYLKKSGVGY